MLKISIFILAIALLSACGGSTNSGKKETNPPVGPETPTKPTEPTTPKPANYSYYFGKNNVPEIYSYDHTTGKKALVFSDPKEVTLSTNVTSDGLTTMGTVFLFKDGNWKFVTPKDNTVKSIASASNILEICDATALTTPDKTYLYYATPGVDKDCSIDVDNLSYRIDTSMSEDSSPLVLDSTLFLAEEREEVITNDTARGFLVKKNFGLDTLMYTNLDLTSTVNLESKVPGYIRTNEFSKHDSIIVRFNNKLFDLTLAQLESGNIGEAFFTGTSVATYASRNQMYYTEGKNLYKYDLAKKESTLIHTVTAGGIADVEINSKGVLVQLNSGGADFLHISTSDLNDIQVSNITLASASLSSRKDSIEGGFTYSIENVDNTRKAFFVSDEGTATTIDNAEWMNVTATTLDASSPPVLLTYGETINTLSKWSVTAKTVEFVYGQLAKETTGIRVDTNSQSDTLLLSTIASEKSKKDLLYTIDISKAGSLKSIESKPNFTVVF